MSKKLLLCIVLLGYCIGYAQQDAQYTQYMYNTININPAYAGSRGVLSIFALHRDQWVGLDGAPKTNSVSVNTPINNSNIGLGVSLVNDKIGPTTENQFSVDLSYTIPTSETWKLSFGIKGTADFFNLDVTKLNPETAGDPQFQNLDNDFSPNVGAEFIGILIRLISDFLFQILFKPTAMMIMMSRFIKTKSIII